MSSALDVIAYALYAMYLTWMDYVSGDFLLYSCNGNIQNLFFMVLVLPSILVCYYNTH